MKKSVTNKNKVTSFILGESIRVGDIDEVKSCDIEKFVLYLEKDTTK